MRILLFVLLILACLYVYFIYSPAPGKPVLGGSSRADSLQVAQMRRTFLRYVPARLVPGAPLLLVLHGTGQDGAKMRGWSGYQFDLLADRHGFAVAYPDGYEKGWNDCRRTPAKQRGIDDVGFLRELVERMRRENGIDPSRVYAVGYSNGGQMGFRLLAEQPQMLAGLAVAGANLPAQQDNSCTFAHQPPPLMMVSGTADPIVPYLGGEVSIYGLRKFGHVVSSQATAEYFAALAGADEHRRGRPSPIDDGTAVALQAWRKAGRELIRFYTVDGGGHVLPQTAFRYPRMMGKTTRGLDMPSACIDFFGLRPAAMPPPGATAM